MQKESWENEAKPQDPILAAFGGKDGPPGPALFCFRICVDPAGAAYRAAPPAE